MSSEPFAPLDGGQAPKRQRPLWTPLVPVPKDAPQPPDSHAHLGSPTATWRYPNAGGQTLCYVLRFDTAEGKAFRPLSFAQPSTAGRRPEWRWESLPPKRPLYGLDRLAERPAAPVVVTEGEKACDAAGGLLPGFVAVTSPNGSKNAGKADWSPL